MFVLLFLFDFLYDFFKGVRVDFIEIEEIFLDVNGKLKLSVSWLGMFIFFVFGWRWVVKEFDGVELLVFEKEWECCKKELGEKSLVID